MNWEDQLHVAILGIANLANRSDVDAHLLRAAGVKLDRALFPLLSQIGLAGEISTVALANLVGRDHSTISRQAAKLDELGLVVRTTSREDKRVRLLTPSDRGQALLQTIGESRREILRRHFSDWTEQDRSQLIKLMTRVTSPR